MTSNFLLLNSDKTVIVSGPKHLRNKVPEQILTLKVIILASSNTGRNLGVILMRMSFNVHIKQFFTALSCICSIPLTSETSCLTDAEKQVHAVITFRLEYCNSLISKPPWTFLKYLHGTLSEVLKTGFSILAEAVLMWLCPLKSPCFCCCCDNSLTS